MPRRTNSCASGLCGRDYIRIPRGSAKRGGARRPSTWQWTEIPARLRAGDDCRYNFAFSAAEARELIFGVGAWRDLIPFIHFFVTSTWRPWQPAIGDRRIWSPLACD
jgi:hypothetical protein